MDPLLADLIQLLRLEQLELNLFRGESRDIGSPRVFGGQVLGQAVMAASATVSDRQIHSLHAYFLRPGDFRAPIVYDVDRARDGLSFSMRRVVAIQRGRQIFNLSASFQKPEDGLSHQVEMPAATPPESLQDARDVALAEADQLPDRLRRFFTAPRPFEFRLAEPATLAVPHGGAPRKHVWFKAIDALPDEDVLHRAMLSYVSDYHLVDTAALAHGVTLRSGNVQMASLDHAMWFHRQVRVDDWLLYAMDSPSASGARGLARGSIFDRAGTLVASTCQEGLLRVWSDEAAGGAKPS